VRTGVNAIGGWAGRAKPTRHSVGEREAESARAARGGTGVTAVAEHGQTYCQTVSFDGEVSRLIFVHNVQNVPRFVNKLFLA
jgi:hypothetical protein